MGKTMNGSDLRKRPFSELTISEQAAVLKARYEEGTSEPASQRIKARETIGEEYGLSGSSVGRLLKMNDLIDPLKDMLDRGSLYTKVALQLEELIRKFNEENNEEAGEHWTPRDVVELMADLVFMPIADKIKDASYSCYSGGSSWCRSRNGRNIKYHSGGT